MKDNYKGDSAEAVGDSPSVSREELIARIASFLRSQKKDFKPQIILDNYLRTYSDRPTLRDIQEVLLLDGAFIRTRSGHYQVKQAVEKPRWEPLDTVGPKSRCLSGHRSAQSPPCSSFAA